MGKGKSLFLPLLEAEGAVPWLATLPPWGRPLHLRGWRRETHESRLRLPDQCFSLRHSEGHYRRPVTAVMGPQGTLGCLALPGASSYSPPLPLPSPLDTYAHPPPTTASENCMWRAWRAPHSLGLLSCYIMETQQAASFISSQTRRSALIAFPPAK